MGRTLSVTDSLCDSIVGTIYDRTLTKREILKNKELNRLMTELVTSMEDTIKLKL